MTEESPKLDSNEATCTETYESKSDGDGDGVSGDGDDGGETVSSNDDGEEGGYGARRALVFSAEVMFIPDTDMGAIGFNFGPRFDKLTPDEFGYVLSRCVKSACRLYDWQPADVAGPLNADLYDLRVEDVKTDEPAETEGEKVLCGEMVSYGAPTRCARGKGHDGPHTCCGD